MLSTAPTKTKMDVLRPRAVCPCGDLNKALQAAAGYAQMNNFNAALDFYEAMLQLYPQSDVLILAQAYDTVYARLRKNKCRYRMYQSRFFDFGIRPGQTVLDIGSGHHPFPYATHLADLSIQDGSIGRGGSAFKNENGKPVFECSVEQMPFKDGEFDFVYCSHVLEHVQSPEKACRELMRIAARGYIETPTKGKDIFFNNQKISRHRWAVDLFDGRLVFTEYQPQELQGLECDILGKMGLSPKTDLEKAFYAQRLLKADILNTMLYWENSFQYEVRALVTPAEKVPAVRQTVPAGTGVSPNPPQRIALLVSIPQRQDSLRKVITTIQPQVDQIRIMLNGFTEVPQELAALDKVTVIKNSPSGDLYASAAWQLLTGQENAFIVMIDDDIIYPPDYVDRMVLAVEKHKRRAVMVVHGMNFKEPFEDTIRDRDLCYFEAPLEKEKTVQVGGVGTLVFHTDTIRPALSDFPNPNFRDLWFSILAARSSVPIICVARRRQWLTQIKTEGSNIFKMSHDQDWRETKNKVFRDHLLPLLNRRVQKPTVQSAEPQRIERHKPVITPLTKPILPDQAMTIFSFTNSRRSFEYSLKSLEESHDRQAEIVVIRDMQFLEAVTKALETCTTPYFLKVDDDFILHPQAVAYLRKRLMEVDEPETLGIYYCHLWEDWTTRVRESIKVYSAAALRAIGGFKVDDKGKADRATNALLKESGFRIVADPSVIALHVCGDWDEQLRYEQLWSRMAAAPYKKPTHEQMKKYSGTKTLQQQFEMRNGFLEQVNQKLNTPFHQFIDSSAMREKRVLAPPALQSPTPEPSAPPKVSVIMACHNAEKYLAETMDSLLAQTLTEWELLVIDDGSTDQTPVMLKAWADKDRRIRFWRFEDKKGPYLRRNFAIQQARADFVSIQDADDIMSPRKLQVLHTAIQTDPRFAVVGSFFRRFWQTYRGEDFGDRVDKLMTHQEIIEAFPRTWHLCWHGSAIIRKSLFETIGLYDQQPYGSDTFWLSKAGLYSYLTGKVFVANVPQYLTFKREHPESQTGTISPVDPRCRRHKLETYYIAKLSKIMEQARLNPAMDVAAELRACTCADFIPRFEHLFNQWESQPVDDPMCKSLIDKAMLHFTAEQYVSCRIVLNGLERMTGGKSRQCKNLNFTCGLAAYASGDDAAAVEFLTDEIRISQHPAAVGLLGRIQAGAVPAQAWRRRKEIKDYINAESRKNLPSVQTSALSDPASDNTNRQSVLAGQFSGQAQPQPVNVSAAGVL